MDKIYAVVLSYKRKDLLKRCLDGIGAQSRPCDAIIVVDNASNDGTEEMLLESVCKRCREKRHEADGRYKHIMVFLLFGVSV